MIPAGLNSLPGMVELGGTGGPTVNLRHAADTEDGDSQEQVRRTCGPDATLSGGRDFWAIDVPIDGGSKLLRVAWQNLGEGRWGLYNASNPEDVNYLRFVTRRRSADEELWTDVDRGSFLTRVAATASADAQVRALAWVAREIMTTVASGEDLGRRVRQISWVSELDFSGGSSVRAPRLLVS